MITTARCPFCTKPMTFVSKRTWSRFRCEACKCTFDITVVSDDQFAAEQFWEKRA